MSGDEIGIEAGGDDDLRSLASRIERIEAQLAIGQLASRYAIAADAKDVDTWVSLYVPDVEVAHGDGGTGHDALRAWIVATLQMFGRTMHKVCGHRIDLVDADHATGVVYCQAEHEVGERWITVAMRYVDTYRRVDGEWLFEWRTPQYWYATDVGERPQEVDWDSWFDRRPSLPDAFDTWVPFWDAAPASVRRPAPSP
jgi:ketosteroid isomerase-like protein